MNLIFQNLDKDNLHHAFLIEGDKEELLPQIFSFAESLGVATVGNADFTHIHIDSFKIDDARNLKALATEKGYSENKKIFVVSVNSFLFEAQNTLLKMFEEPIENTHFFIIIPDRNALLPTLISRFYFITAKNRKNEDNEIENFLRMPLFKRIDYIKDMLVEEEQVDEEGKEIESENSARARAMVFLNGIESIMGASLKNNPDNKELLFSLEHVFKVRKFLRMPGSSTKSLMESVALVTPHLLK